MKTPEMDQCNRDIANIRNNAQIEFSDDYEHHDEIEYVPENVLQSSDVESESFRNLHEQFNSFISHSCQCISAPAHTTDIHLCGESAPLCKHERNYCRWTDDKGQYELILNPQRPSKDLIYECSDQCACPANCGNRLVQFGPRKHLQIADLTHLQKNFGLITLHRIPAGAFVCEYAGEILTRDEVSRRHANNDSENVDNYIICLNERSSMAGKEDMPMQTFIDPSRRGNIGRYLNHSCDPNCEILSVRIDGPIPKLG